MKILITMGLADRSLEHHIRPIIAVEDIEKILIVRDRAGPTMDKVIYIIPPEWCIKSPILKTIFKFVLLLHISLRDKPEMIHGFLLFPYGVMSYLAGRLTRKRIGLSLIAGAVELYMSLEESPIGKYPYNRALPKISGVNQVLLHITKNMDAITTTGNFSKKFLIENGVPEHRIFVLPHVVDDRFKPTNSEKVYDVVYIGRLAKVKHVETLIRAIARARIDLPGIRVVIVGTGPEETNLKLLSKELDLDKILDFVGYQSNVWDWFNKSKISVLTSEREGFPYAVIEALNCGLPIITSNCGDVCDLVKDGYNGIIINDYYNYNEFARAIVKLLKNDELISKYSINALKSAEGVNFKIAVDTWRECLNI